MESPGDYLTQTAPMSHGGPAKGPAKGSHGGPAKRPALHVDSADAGVVALIPDRHGPFTGWERADSVVVNRHKWLFTPLDASLLLTSRMPVLRDPFSLVPEYLRTLCAERR